jgi:serine/threonine-protein kinase
MEEPRSRADFTGASPPELRFGSYRVLELLGTGGMSSVYRAVHVDSGHVVALKILNQSVARNSTLLQRFLREARSAESLEHVNIVAIYDRGIDQGRHYLVLEYVPGRDFHEFVQRRGPLSAAEAISVARGVASGMSYAAGRGLIHRDIKPSNILRTPSGEPKIIDLGLALQSEFEDERVTREGTTVGTVDYMAPEQARDSRATSIQSDMYSLGCTFYYLLSGVPPYPGGDITDKLSRHARAAAPDICDLRPDVSAAVGAIIRRMMAKRPEDRFATYEELLAELDAVPVDADDQAPTFALAPVHDLQDGDAPESSSVPDEGRRRLDSSADGAAEPALPLESLAGLAAELSGEMRSVRSRPDTQENMAPLPRLGRTPAHEAPDEKPDDAHPAAEIPAKAAGSSVPWLGSAAVISATLILVVVGATLFLKESPETSTVVQNDVDAGAVPVLEPPVERPPAPTLPVAKAIEQTPPHQQPDGVSLVPERAVQRLPWREPPDNEPSPGDSVGAREYPGNGDEHLPKWARNTKIDRSEGPTVVVRRVAEPGDAQTLPSLHVALDRYIGGTIELADNGPLPIDDLRISGRTRLIRPRRGFRPIIRVARSNLDAMRLQPAVVPLERKAITLEGIDLIVNVDDLSSRQTALFAGAGSDLTLRNCTITIINPRGAPFAVVRVDGSTAEPSRVRIERTLVRGAFTQAVDISGGRADVLVFRSAVLGGTGPLVRVAGREGGAEPRLDFIEAVLAGPGPVVALAQESSPAKAKPIVIRAFGSAFGRLQGPGIASVISSASALAVAEHAIDWAGDRNLFAGWRGFFARGKEPTIVVRDLGGLRSTWNGTDRDSQEFLAAWPPPPDLALATPSELASFVPDRAALLQQIAKPRAGLFEQTVTIYTSPVVPEAIGWAVDHQLVPANVSRGARSIGPADAAEGVRARVVKKASSESPRVTAAGIVEVVMNTADPPWEGDLGAFLRSRLQPGMKHVRVRVVGTGMHPFTPVRLEPGAHLEIRVESQGGSEPPSWSSAPQATGPALIEVRDGALVLSHVRLAHGPDSQVENLLAVEDAHLVVSHCQLTVPPSLAGARGGLIAFRAATTQPRPFEPLQPMFTVGLDRPVCRLIDSTLITNGTALRAELGRGLVALKQCAVAAGETAIELVPATVARSRFDADLALDQCTLASERSVVRLGPWRGHAPGPDRPWLVTSRDCAYLSISDRRTRGETVLLRADSDALARGALFWQAQNDAIEVDQLTTAGEGFHPGPRARDVQLQWIQFWGQNHMSRVSGARGTNSTPSVMFTERPRPGRVEPADLILNPTYHPGRDRLSIGADLARQGIGKGLARP